ncbi:MAG: hypothetical protein JW904_11400 [Spirochaetales bacterium]|nr:hypothetical protein [Spirochaetales bacterium]
MVTVEKTSKDPGVQVQWAVRLLHMTFQELETKYPDYETLDANLNAAKKIVCEHQAKASAAALKILAEDTPDTMGYAVMCLIQGMQKVKTAEWIQYLHDASADMRDAVSQAAKEALAIAGESTGFASLHTNQASRGIV